MRCHIVLATIAVSSGCTISLEDSRNARAVIERALADGEIEDLYREGLYPALPQQRP